MVRKGFSRLVPELDEQQPEKEGASLGKVIYVRKAKRWKKAGISPE